MTLKEISQCTGIPYSTLTKWNNLEPTDYRKNIVEFLKEQDRSVLLKTFELSRQKRGKP